MFITFIDVTAHEINKFTGDLQQLVRHVVQMYHRMCGYKKSNIVVSQNGVFCCVRATPLYKKLAARVFGDEEIEDFLKHASSKKVQYAKRLDEGKKKKMQLSIPNFESILEPWKMLQSSLSPNPEYNNNVNNEDIDDDIDIHDITFGNEVDNSNNNLNDTDNSNNKSNHGKS